MSYDFQKEFKCEFLEEMQEPNKDLTAKESSILLRRATSEKFDKIDTIPLSVLILYSMPSFGKMSCLVLLSIHAILYYESIGASLLYMSFFVTLARAFEMLLKPTIAYLSDELKSSLGRRKPFMLFGCGFYAVFLVMLFSPPSLKTGTKNLSLWFGVFYVLFFIAETISNVPYLALGPELSTNSAEREKLYVFFYIFQYIGVLFASVAPIVLNRIFYECDCSICYNNPLIIDIGKCINKCEIICNVRVNQQSLCYLAILIGSFFVISIILLSLKVREKHKSFNNEPMRLIPSLYQLINNKPFLSLIIPWIFDVTIMTIFSTMLPFFLNFIINPQKYCIDHNVDLKSLTCSANYWLGTIISVFFICCIIFCYLWHLLVDIFGKKKCWQYLSLLCIIPFGLFIFCEEGSYLLVIICGVLIAFPSAGNYLNDVLVSDTIDYSEFYTGKRNEGIFTVCSAFIPKVVSLFAQAIPLSFMAVIGFVPSDKGIVKDQPIQVKWFIRLFFSVVPIVISIASFFLKFKYPIENDETMIKIKTAIILQKENIVGLQSKCDCYTIQDPIYNHLHMNIMYVTISHLI